MFIFCCADFAKLVRETCLFRLVKKKKKPKSKKEDLCVGVRVIRLLGTLWLSWSDLHSPTSHVELHCTVPHEPGSSSLPLFPALIYVPDLCGVSPSRCVPVYALWLLLLLLLLLLYRVSADFEGHSDTHIYSRFSANTLVSVILIAVTSLLALVLVKETFSMSGSSVSLLCTWFSLGSALLLAVPQLWLPLTQHGCHSH